MILSVIIVYVAVSIIFSITNLKPRKTMTGREIEAMPPKQAFKMGFLEPLFIALGLAFLAICVRAGENILTALAWLFQQFY